MGAKIRVHLVHGQALTAAGLIRLLEDEPDINPVLIGSCAEQCNHACMQPEPDVLLLELSANHNCGLDCIRQIIARHPGAKILILSELSNGLRPAYTLAAGARGFITHQTPPEQLAFAIREVVKGGIYIEPRVAGKMKRSGNGDNADIVTILSAREYQIFLLIVEGHNTGDIAKSLHVSDKTVANHHTQIMHKLDVSNPVELTRLAIRHGIIKA